MSVAQELLGLLKLRLLRILALIALVVGVGIECFITKLAVLDPDIWWHLSVGDWIVHSHAFPHNGIFSRTAGDHVWRAYSWGYEVLLSQAYAYLGILGVGIFGTALTLAVALFIFCMLLRLSGRFWVAWLLSILVYCGFLFNIAPRPVFFTASLFIITLTLLLESHRTGTLSPLYWLPLIFLIWANCHIQFIYGMAALGVFVGANVLQRVTTSLKIAPDLLGAPVLPLAPLLLVFVCCVLATGLGPYSFALYRVVFEYAGSKFTYARLIEFQPLSFKYPSQFTELLLAAAGFFALGWKKRIDLFKLLLLILASIFAFRTWRDAWFICLVSISILADRFRQEERDCDLSFSNWTIVVSVSVMLLVLSARSAEFNTRALDRVISGQFPVDAVNFLRRNPVGGPLYNTFDWGGFLIFYMPQYPVSIDGRTDLYGDAMDNQYYSTQEADPSYIHDPALNESGLVLVNTKFPIATQLLADRRFRLIYQDNMAVVFARNW
jgi:hypothetical protein